MKTATRKKPAAIPVAKITTISKADLPALGANFAGGKFAGITMHGDALHALVLLPGAQTALNWSGAKAWAKGIGGDLPSRHDGLVLVKNLKGEFEREWYWLCDEVADDPASAWCQGFTWGNQRLWYKDSKVRARAVRRIPIQ